MEGGGGEEGVVQGGEVDAGGALVGVAEGGGDHGHGDAMLVSDGGPGVASHISGEGRGDAGKGAYSLEASVDAPMRGLALASCLVGIGQVVDDGQQIGTILDSIAVDDGPSLGRQPDVDELVGLLAPIGERIAADIGLAQIGGVDKGYPLAIVQKQENVARIRQVSISERQEAYARHLLGAQGAFDGGARRRDHGIKGMTVGDQPFGHRYAVGAAQPAHVGGYAVGAEAAAAHRHLELRHDGAGDLGEAEIGQALLAEG